MGKKLLAEAAGTFALLFAGTGAIVINDISGGAVTHLGVSLTFGLIVMAVIYAIGDVSGAHINPAVTLGFLAVRRIGLRTAGLYIASQCAGAIAASLLLRAMCSAHPDLGATIPAGSSVQSFFVEVILTLILMFVVLIVSTGPRERGFIAGVAVGAVVGLGSFFAGPISGASMNPARSLAPALATLRFESLWIYLAAPAIGALVAVPLCRGIHRSGCCSKEPQREST